MPITPISFRSQAGGQSEPALPMAVWRPGTRVDRRYVISHELGRGGGGLVLQARDTELERDVALKVVAFAGALDELTLQRFKREAVSAARLQHPGIVGVHEVGEHGGHPFLVMDLVSGENLEAALARDGPMAPRRAAEIAEQVARALHHAHERGVVHRDVKPENILIERSGRALLTDFGLARGRPGTADMSLTATGEIVGTPLFMAPEQANDAIGAIGSWTDIWATGAVLYAMLTARPPFPDRVLLDLLLAIQREPHEPIARLRPDAPPALVAIADRCLSKRPADRFASADQLARELRRYIDRASAPREAFAELATTAPAAGASPARRAAVLAGAVCLTALVAGAIAWRAGAGSARRAAEAARAARAGPIRAEAEKAWDELARARSEAAADGADEEATLRAIAAGLEAMRAAAALEASGDPGAGAAVARACSQTAELALAAERLGLLAHCSARLRRLGETERADELDRAGAAVRARNALAEQVEALIDEGRDRRRRGDDEGALGAYSRAIALDPEHSMARTRRAELHVRRERFGDAIADFDAALRIDPDNTRALRGRASARLGARDFAGAIEDFTRLVATDPENFEAYQTRGYCHWSLGDLQAAIDDHTRALKIEPDYVLARYNRGFCYWQRGEHDRAIADFDGVAARDPRHGLTYLYRGQAHEARGDRERALADYEQATRTLAPGSPQQREAEQLRARAATALGRQ